MRGRNVYTPVDPSERFSDHMTCSAGITKAVVEVDGSVGGCQYLGSEGGPAGRTVLFDDFFDIWTEGVWDYFRVDFPDIAAPCRNCKHRSYCVGNCLALAGGRFDHDNKLELPHECSWYEPAASAGATRR